MKNAIITALLEANPFAHYDEKSSGCTVVSGTTGNVYWTASGSANVTVMAGINRNDPDICQGTTLIESIEDAVSLIKSLEGQGKYGVIMIRAIFFKYLWLLELILGGKREEVRNELKELLSQVAMGTQSKSNGICYCVRVNSGYSLSRLDLGFGIMSWEEYSGDAAFPISDPDGKLKPSKKYWASTDKWSGEYGEARIRLLKHLYDVVKQATQVA